ncbi:MAG: helix-turn-helix domain-containing protein [Bacilli bacterium]
MEKEKILLDLEYDFICDFIKLRKEKGLTQKSLAELSGVIREKIAKIENHLNSPQINSLIKILEPIGYTIKIVPIQKKD